MIFKVDLSRSASIIIKIEIRQRSIKISCRDKNEEVKKKGDKETPVKIIFPAYTYRRNNAILQFYYI